MFYIKAITLHEVTGMRVNKMEDKESELEEEEEPIHIHKRYYNNNNKNDVVFPPVNHEGLPPYPPIIQHLPPPPPDDVSDVYDVAIRWVCQLKAKFIPTVLSLSRGFCVNRLLGRGVAVTAGLIVWWFYCKVVRSWKKRRRDRLDIVIKEKDEKIKQLLHQIAQMNQLLLSLHKGSLSHGGSAT